MQLDLLSQRQHVWIWFGYDAPYLRPVILILTHMLKFFSFSFVADIEVNSGANLTELCSLIKLSVNTWNHCHRELEHRWQFDKTKKQNANVMYYEIHGRLIIVWSIHCSLCEVIFLNRSDQFVKPMRHDQSVVYSIYSRSVSYNSIHPPQTSLSELPFCICRGHHIWSERSKHCISHP